VPEAVQSFESIVPHEAAEHDAANHVTPAPLTSQFTVAVRFAVLPAGTVVGAIEAVTAMGLMGIVAEMELEESFEVAVTTTEPPGGMVEGAVNCVTESLAVSARLNDPHAKLPQVAVHFTPAALRSFDTVTAND
jgi:hypothetical protein